MSLGSRVEAVEEIPDLRNRILHENLDTEVTGIQLARAMVTAVGLPISLYFIAEKVHPSGVDSGMSEEELENSRDLVDRAMKKTER